MMIYKSISEEERKWMSRFVKKSLERGNNLIDVHRQVVDRLNIADNEWVDYTTRFGDTMRFTKKGIDAVDRFRAGVIIEKPEKPKRDKITNGDGMIRGSLIIGASIVLAAFVV